MFKRKDKQESATTHHVHLFTQHCDDASDCTVPALLDNHVQWTVPNIGRVHQYYCQVHWDAKQTRVTRKVTRQQKAGKE